MAHQYKVGDKIRIKKREGLANDYPFDFCGSMNELAGTICEIKDIIPVENFSYSQCKYINDDYHMYDIRPVDSSDRRDFVWAWHSSMFELVETELEPPQKIRPLRKKFSIGDFVGFCDCVGEIEKHKDLYFLILCYEQDRLFSHHELCMGIANKVPQWRDIARDLGAVHYQEITGFFPEFKTIEQLMDFVEAVNNAYQSKHITTPKTLNENEIKFQKPKAAFSRGSVPKGNPICGRKHKTAIVIGHLSNQEISC